MSRQQPPIASPAPSPASLQALDGKAILHDLATLGKDSVERSLNKPASNFFLDLVSPDPSFFPRYSSRRDPSAPDSARYQWFDDLLNKPGLEDVNAEELSQHLNKTFYEELKKQPQKRDANLAPNAYDLRNTDAVIARLQTLSTKWEENRHTYYRNLMRQTYLNLREAASKDDPQAKKALENLRGFISEQIHKINTSLQEKQRQQQQVGPILSCMHDAEKQLQNNLFVHAHQHLHALEKRAFVIDQNLRKFKEETNEQIDQQIQRCNEALELSPDTDENKKKHAELATQLGEASKKIQELLNNKPIKEGTEYTTVGKLFNSLRLEALEKAFQQEKDGTRAAVLKAQIDSIDKAKDTHPDGAQANQADKTAAASWHQKLVGLEAEKTAIEKKIALLTPTGAKISESARQHFDDTTNARTKLKALKNTVNALKNSNPSKQDKITKDLGNLYIEMRVENPGKLSLLPSMKTGFTTSSPLISSLQDLVQNCNDNLSKLEDIIRQQKISPEPSEKFALLQKERENARALLAHNANALHRFLHIHRGSPLLIAHPKITELCDKVKSLNTFLKGDAKSLSLVTHDATAALDNTNKSIACDITMKVPGRKIRKMSLDISLTQAQIHEVVAKLNEQLRKEGSNVITVVSTSKQEIILKWPDDLTQRLTSALKQKSDEIKNAAQLKSTQNNQTSAVTVTTPAPGATI
jgi:hypothetical protein